MTSDDALPHNQLDRRHLTCLVALADAGSFKDAAARLFVTPSAVASAIRQMERSLGMSLVERRGAAITVNPVGWEVVEQARRALEALDEVGADRNRDGRAHAGVLQIMATPTTAGAPAGQVAATLRRRNPGLFVRIISASRAVVADVTSAVLDKAADAGISERPRREVNGLHTVPLERWEVHYVFPAGTGPRSDHASVAEIVEHGLIAVPHFETSMVYSDLVRVTQAIDGAVRVRSAFREHFADLAFEGVAGYLCHHPELPETRALGLRTAPIEGGVTRDIVAFVRSDRRSGVTTDFLDACRAYRESRAR